MHLGWAVVSHTDFGPASFTRMKTVYLPDQPVDLPAKVARMLPALIKKSTNQEPKSIVFLNDFHGVWLCVVEVETGFFLSHVFGQMVENSLIVTQAYLRTMEPMPENQGHKIIMNPEGTPPRLILLWDTQEPIGRAAIGLEDDDQFQLIATTVVM